MNSRFKGKVALVAGGTGGLGRAVSLAFLQEGATVIVTYKNQSEFDTLRSAAGPNSSMLQGGHVDVTDEVAIREFVDRVLTEHSSLDILVNSVGAYVGGVKLWELDSKTFDQMLALNLRSGYLLSRAVVPAMLK